MTTICGTKIYESYEKTAVVEAEAEEEADITKTVASLTKKVK